MFPIPIFLRALVFRPSICLLNIMLEIKDLYFKKRFMETPHSLQFIMRGNSGERLERANREVRAEDSKNMIRTVRTAGDSTGVSRLLYDLANIALG